MTGGGFEIRAGRAADNPGIGRVQAACPEAAQWPLGDYSNFEMLVAVGEAGVVGFCAWRQTAADEAELLNLAVDPSVRRQGIARALLEELRRVAHGEIFLEVAAPNTGATELYRSLGWQGIGVRAGYYGQGTIDAVVMKRSS
ncbi:MAG: GCN5-related N-acetyltransferase [Bryobacterales bacterium]|nr:GCN5-related N-acetyltransferase [Bryobacterales bacterium]